MNENKNSDRIIIHNELELAEKLRDNRHIVYNTKLSTDDRVIARVTDGIYRQPGSALRELISNAYDADAREVRITTDAPRFEKIRIEDDGHGMSPTELAYIINHIGGSSKRNSIGTSMGVTHSDNPDLSPRGRKLIGKIGIGLFSVAQLTQTFQIITKRKDDNYRTIAVVSLKQYSEMRVQDSEKYDSGSVNIWTENAQDLESHGTTIILDKIRPQTKETLKSKQLWDSIAASKDDEAREEGTKPLPPPIFHIGTNIDKNEEILLEIENNKYDSLPWDENDNPEIAFKKLVNAVWDQNKTGTPKPKLEDLFDNYLNMIWSLSLSIPTTYVESDIFSIPFQHQFVPFLISNNPKGQAQEIEIKEGETLKQVLEIESDEDDSFSVYIDDLKLSRPILYTDLPPASHALKKPLVFIGKLTEKFEGLPLSASGGPLSFYSYLFWYPKISPVEHQGVMLRVNNASGTLFDPTFMRYQVQELTRRSQVTSEIFVTEGLDSALNIDRESFNFSHIHVLVITRWLHNAMRQLANKQKQLARNVRKSVSDEKSLNLLGSLNHIVERSWLTAGNDRFQAPPSVSIKYNTDDSEKINNQNEYIINLNKNDELKRKPTFQISEEKIRAITMVLASYGALESVPLNKRNEMIKDIFEIIMAEA